jgi:hypothetical protein
MKNSKRNKRYNNNLNTHAKRRVFERYNIELTNNDLDKMIKIIQSGGAEFVQGKTNTRVVHIVTYLKTKFRVLYSASMKRIVTFLPFEEENTNG